MTTVVIDTSVVVSWFLPDEKQGKYSDIYRNINEYEIHVPQIFYYEFCNVLAMAEKRKRIDLKTLSSILEIVWRLPIQVDPVDTLSAPDYFENVMSATAAYSLTTYDAAYIELACRLGSVPLLTYDRALIEVAKKIKLRADH